MNNNPNQIQHGYKLFEQDIRTGELYPLFIDKKEALPLKQWLQAKNIKEHKGFAHRPGYHISNTVPDAPWLKGADGTYKSQRGKNFRRVWAGVCYKGYDINQEMRNMGIKQLDYVPENAYYSFKESADKDWIISSNIYIRKILTEGERQILMNMYGYDERKAFEPYKKKFEKRKMGGN